VEPPAVDLGSVWSEIGAEDYDGRVTLSRTVTLGRNATDWSVLVGPVYYGTVRIYADGVDVGGVGRLESASVPFPNPVAAVLPEIVVEDGEVELRIVIDRAGWLAVNSDPNSIVVGGIRVGPSVELVDRQELVVRRALMDDLDKVVLGIVFLLAGLVHLYLYRGAAGRMAYLWFGVGAVAFGLNMLVVSEWASIFLPSYDWSVRVGAAAGHVAVVGLFAFLFAALEQPVGNWVSRYLQSHGLLAALVLVAPVALVWDSTAVRMLWLLPALYAGYVALAGGIRDGHPEAQILVVGAAGLATALAAEILRALASVPVPEGMPTLGFSFMLLTMSMGLAGRFLRLHQQQEELAQHLEGRVLDRTAELAQAAEAAEEASRAKSQFLANMSHELRTPLNSVIGFSNVLVRRVGKDMEPRDRDFLQRIRASGEHLLAIVNDILDISRIEAGKLEVVSETVDVADVVRDAVESHRKDAQSKGIDLAANVPEGKAEAMLDPNRLKQVLDNLIGNAVKFTESGGVEVRMVVEKGRPSRIEVRDSGMGVPPEKLEEIFRPFEQVDSSMSRRYHGTGLGLTLSRALCELMGCTLEASSVVNEGSTFTIGLPTPARVRGRRVASGSAAASGGPSGRHVLVIDDDADARTLLAETLGELGCTVTFARSGEEGLDRAREFRPDLITLDLHMPGLDGWETLRRIRADEKLAEIPVMVVSVSATQSASQVGNMLGDVDVLDKPVSMNALQRVVERHLGPDRRRILVVDDDAGVRSMMEEMLESVEADVRTASDGIHALEVLQEFNAGLIFLDLLMPRMGGMELLSRLRSDPKWAGTPIIVVTSKDLSEEEERVLAENTQAVVGKAGATDLKNRLNTFFPRG